MSRTAGQSRGEDGAILVLMLIVIFAAAALILGLSVDSAVEFAAASSRGAQVEALYIAEAGMQRALQNLAINKDWRGDQPNSGYAFAAGDNLIARGRYLVTIAPYDGSIGLYPAGSLFVTSIGEGFRGVRRTVNIVASPGGGGPPQAVCSCTSVTASGSVTIDSFKSSEGAYGVGPLYSNGDVGANTTLTFSSGAAIKGDLLVGGAASGAGGATVTGNVTCGSTVSGLTVTGSTSANVNPDPSPCDCSSLDLTGLINTAQATNNNAGILPNNANPYTAIGNSAIDPGSIYSGSKLALGGSNTIILSGGTYYFDELTLGGSSSIQVGVDANSDAVVDGPPTQPVLIYVRGKVTLGGAGLINAGRPTDAQIFTNGLQVGLSGTAPFKGFVYAPLAKLDLSGPAMQGALAAKEVAMSGGSVIHYDQDLVSAVGTRLRLATWREL